MSRPRAKNKKNNGFRNLLFFLLLYIFGSPFLLEYQPLVVIAHLSLSVTLFFSVYAVQKQQNHRSFAVLMLLPLLTLYWLGIYDVITFSRLGSYIFSAIYFGLLVFSFATQILRTPKITLAVLYATLCLYLIIGLFWGTLYALLYELSPVPTRVRFWKKA
jgi:hypothetical protein